MQSTPLTLATLHNVTQAATLCPKVDSSSHNTSWIYGNSPPARRVPSPNFDVSAASLTTLKLACLFHAIGWVNNHLYDTRLLRSVSRSLVMDCLPCLFSSFGEDHKQDGSPSP